MDRRENFLKAVNFDEGERVPIDCSTHCGIMKQKLEELAEYFGVKDPEYRENIVGMCSTMDERIWSRLPIDTRTVLLNPPDSLTITTLTDNTFQVSDYGFIMKKAPYYNEFWDFPLKDATAANVASSKWWPDARDKGRVRGLRDQVKALYDDTDFVLKLETPVPGLMETTQRMRGLERWFADLILEEFKPCLIVVNKWDQVRGVQTGEDQVFVVTPIGDDRRIAGRVTRQVLEQSAGLDPELPADSHRAGRVFGLQVVGFHQQDPAG